MRVQIGTHVYQPTRRGRIFEAVYSGTHGRCEQSWCPCQELTRPLRIDLEGAARQLMQARGLTIEQARATLYDW